MATKTTKTWVNYLTVNAAAIRSEIDLFPELPDKYWEWGSLGEANQQKFRAQRAVQIGHFSYFLMEPDNIRSQLNPNTIGWLFPSLSALANPILNWKTAYKTVESVILRINIPSISS